MKMMEPNADNFKLIEQAISNIDKKYGKGSTFILDSNQRLQNVDIIPTGSIALNNALVVGGLPKGRIVEFFGPEMSGKSSLALQCVAEAQKLGILCAYIDAEHALDITYSKSLGVKVNELIVCQPDYGEMALDVAEELIQSNNIGVIVIDSVAALVPKAELEGEMGQSVIGGTPIIIRKKGSDKINIVSIASMYHGSKNFIDKRYQNRYKKVKSIEVLTANGWKKVNSILFKKNVNNKPVVITNILNGIAITTGDHSLFSNKAEKKPSELKIGDKLDVLKINNVYNTDNGFNNEIAWIVGYFCAEGSVGSTKNVFSVCDTTESNINEFEVFSKRNFNVYTKKSLCDNSSIKTPNTKTLYRLYIFGDPILTSIFNKCIDTSTKEKTVPDFILNANNDIKISFLNGFKQGDGVVNKAEYSLSTSSFQLLAGLTYIFDCLEFKYYINSNYRQNKENNKPEFNITQVKTDNIKQVNEITKFIYLPPPEFLYDIETDDGTFVGGVGNIIHHNSHMGLQARLMSQALRKLTGIVAKSNSIIIFINQLREKIGITWGSNETTPGGKALKFYASIRIDIRKTGHIKDGSEIIGNHVKVKVVKNKVAAPFKEAEFDLIFGKGIDRLSEIIDLAVERKIIDKSGAWYSYKGERLGQGKEQSKTLLSMNPDMVDEITKQIYTLEPVVTKSTNDDDSDLDLGDIEIGTTK